MRRRRTTIVKGDGANIDPDLLKDEIGADDDDDMDGVPGFLAAGQNITYEEMKEDHFGALLETREETGLKGKV